MITSFGLPVVMTTGRLVPLVLTGLTRHPVEAVAAVVTCLVSALCWGAATSLRRRRILRRASTS
jgi:hypothetical protein